jgi:hypothetical protein
VLIGYMRVSKADGSLTLDLQRDALLARFFTLPNRNAAMVALGGGTPRYRRGTLACCGAAGMRVVIA